MRYEPEDSDNAAVIKVEESGRQRRVHERKSHCIQIGCNQDGSRFFGTVIDFSIGGTCFETEHNVKTGSELKLKFKGNEKNLDRLELRAEVVWVQPVSLFVNRVGIRFLGNMQGTKSVIDNYFFDLPESAAVAGSNRYPHLFSEFSISGVLLKNRVTMAPMFWGYAEEDGTASQTLIDQYVEIARGGAGMIVVANAVVDPSGIMGSRVLRIDQDTFVPGLARLAQEIQKAGAVACLQLNHGGCWAKVKNPLAPSPAPLELPSEVAFSGTFRKNLSGKEQLILVNEFFSRLKNCRSEMSLNEIEKLKKAFGQAAVRAKEAGFQMIELHGATGYLLMQFVSPRLNRRSDRYGGNLKNRLRFPLEVIATIRQMAGDSFPVGYRFLATEWLQGGFSLDDAREFAKALREAGIAYLSITAGTYESFFLPRIMNECRSENYITPYAKEIREEAQGIPIIASGRIIAPQSAERLIKENVTDLVGLARPLFADPLWPTKAMEGKENEIVHCTSCNSCFHKIIRDEPAVCARWDKMKRSDVQIALDKKKNKWGKILIAMDDSENSLEAVKYAAHIIPQARHITLFHVMPGENGTDEFRLKMESLMGQARGILSSAGIDKEFIEIKMVPKRINFGDDILEEIRRGGYGSVIIGRRGISRVQRLIFGSVSGHIVQHARKCAVWVVD